MSTDNKHDHGDDFVVGAPTAENYRDALAHAAARIAALEAEVARITEERNHYNRVALRMQDERDAARSTVATLRGELAALQPVVEAARAFAAARTAYLAAFNPFVNTGPLVDAQQEAVEELLRRVAATPTTPGGEVADVLAMFATFRDWAARFGQSGNLPTVQAIEACRAAIDRLSRALTASEEARAKADKRDADLSALLLKTAEERDHAREIARIAADRDNAITADLDAADALVVELANALALEHEPHVGEHLHGPCVQCIALKRAGEWAK